MLLFDLTMPYTNEKLHDIHIETLIDMYPTLWQKAWIKNIQTNKTKVNETDILEILLNVIEEFCNVFEQETDISIIFNRYEEDNTHRIVDWNIILNHVQINKAYTKRKY